MRVQPHTQTTILHFPLVHDAYLKSNLLERFRSSLHHSYPGQPSGRTTTTQAFTPLSQPPHVVQRISWSARGYKLPWRYRGRPEYHVRDTHLSKSEQSAKSQRLTRLLLSSYSTIVSFSVQCISARSRPITDAPPPLSLSGSLVSQC